MWFQTLETYPIGTDYEVLESKIYRVTVNTHSGQRSARLRVSIWCQQTSNVGPVGNAHMCVCQSPLLRPAATVNSQNEWSEFQKEREIPILC